MVKGRDRIVNEASEPPHAGIDIYLKVAMIKLARLCIYDLDLWFQHFRNLCALTDTNKTSIFSR